METAVELSMARRQNALESMIEAVRGTATIRDSFRNVTMPAEIVNLRKARKVRDRAAKEKRAVENRVKFGRTKAERTTAKAEDARAVRRLEGNRRDDEKPDGGTPGSENGAEP